ncbi:four-carbon acid sugar kinase family protein [Flavisolibacter ginsenosidimutans]|uniref:Four-carbon acid sugar kinase family protein n=1 Tax=Flavisolibacter ginsenosidimutans TaxID=661481 RepID=A0A5B8UIG1_9BACT|nr:four-carbon acid sugar kinase family protein [Flavisolibacter ginsenosidimutans]QEC56166.1 four-carbon acid sugar kinase family protein [Flavisolibacter ginsenosidimutans]
MIVVIADDITGAAELGGIGLRYGLRVRIASDVEITSEVDLLVIYTNARSMKKEEAVALMQHLTRKAKALHPSLFYKKTDSVLRGHVLSEMQAQMRVLGIEKGLLVPVNPLLGRTVKDGHYYLNEQLIHETSFSTDPEFPIRSSRIEDMLGETNIPVNVIAQGEALPEGIAVGEAQTMDDVKHWAQQKEENVFYAGGASFFDALLHTMHEPVSLREEKRLELATPLLFVSGTTFQKNRKKIHCLSSLVCYMPDAVYKQSLPSANEYDAWCSEIVFRLKKTGKAIVAIEERDEKAEAADLREKMSEVVRLVFQQTPVHELLIEGGSTAFGVIQKLGLQSFTPTEELAQGVVRMKANDKDNLHLTIKPGSYEWPAEWNF